MDSANMDSANMDSAMDFALRTPRVHKQANKITTD